MTALNQSTRRRLQQLRQMPSIWEGDRRLLAADIALSKETGVRGQGDCILWVDGTEGLVRAIDVVPGDAGPEAIVRTLLQAMEYPHSSTPPGRPQRIVVCNREIQFFLRGVLQDLSISVDYAPELPLIDEIFRGLQSATRTRPPELPPELVQPILSVAQDIWDIAPWQTLDEEKIISVEMNYGDTGPLYVSILGMLGMEYGLLLYRSLESLKTFRQRVLAATDNAPEILERAFLEQDCLFITFDETEAAFEESFEEDIEEEFAEISDFLDATGVRPSFGNLHPLEGMRPVLYEEEACTVFIALRALQKFFNQHLHKLDTELFPDITSRYRIPDPKDGQKKVSVKVATLPALADELSEMVLEAEGEEDEDYNLPLLRNDLIPGDVFYSLGAMPWETLEVLRATVKFHQKPDVTPAQAADGFPVVLLQTSRPKATELIEALKAAGGVKGICFNPGEDPVSDDRYDLGVLQVNNGELHLFGEFVEDDPVHIQARKKWDQRCKKTKGYCGLVIAKGSKGASRGNPQMSDMLALFEVRAISEKELGLGSLQLMPYME
ncbi:MAG: hypothetical protein MUF49_06175 [Oculatellaceae cyanobacterium Prado106]|jgi:hypothetical protein|nr:hypothetical protein [Oculatellaceae cyanobacterium Prado106]